LPPRGVQTFLLTAGSDRKVRHWSLDPGQTSQECAVVTPSDVPGETERPTYTASHLGDVFVVQEQGGQRKEAPASLSRVGSQDSSSPPSPNHRDAILDLCTISLQNDILVTAGRDGLVKQGAQGKDELKEQGAEARSVDGDVPSVMQPTGFHERLVYLMRLPLMALQDLFYRVVSVMDLQYLLYLAAREDEEITEEDDGEDYSADEDGGYDERMSCTMASGERIAVRCSRCLPLRKPTARAPKVHPATGLPLSRARGQHILHNQGIVQKIIKAAKIQPSDAVYEVGCGTGELTVQLLPQARKVYTIDLEERMVQETRNRAASLGYPNLEVIVGDALRTPLPKRFDVCVSNLPYKISAPIIFKLLQRISQGPPWRYAILMLQREFAERLLADPGEKGFSRLALNVRLFARTVRLFDVAPGSFIPSPEIHSTVVRLEPRLPSPEVDFNEWDALIRVIFSRRRKTLRRQFRKL
ncbi:DIM1A, partial [Symbiodinium microadriaticum]